MKLLSAGLLAVAASLGYAGNFTFWNASPYVLSYSAKTSCSGSEILHQATCYPGQKCRAYDDWTNKVGCLSVQQGGSPLLDYKTPYGVSGKVFACTQPSFNVVCKLSA